MNLSVQQMERVRSCPSHIVFSECVRPELPFRSSRLYTFCGSVFFFSSAVFEAKIRAISTILLTLSSSSLLASWKTLGRNFLITKYINFKFGHNAHWDKTFLWHVDIWPWPLSDIDLEGQRMQNTTERSHSLAVLSLLTLKQEWTSNLLNCGNLLHIHIL